MALFQSGLIDKDEDDSNYDIYAKTCTCKKCGYSIHSYSKFCSECGRKLNMFVYGEWER